MLFWARKIELPIKGGLLVLACRPLADGAMVRHFLKTSGLGFGVLDTLRPENTLL